MELLDFGFEPLTKLPPPLRQSEVGTSGRDLERGLVPRVRVFLSYFH